MVVLITNSYNVRTTDGNVEITSHHIEYDGVVSKIKNNKNQVVCEIPVDCTVYNHTMASVSGLINCATMEEWTRDGSISDSKQFKEEISNMMSVWNNENIVIYDVVEF